MAMKSYKKLLDLLASIEHDQWVTWSRRVSEEETISEFRLKRWKKLWKPYNKLSQADKEIDIEFAEKVLDIIPIKCPIWQCGGWMKAKERKYPKGKTEDDFPNGMNGDIQTPDLVCTNCNGIYQFKGFKISKKEKIDNEEQKIIVDSFFNRKRICQYCKTPTKWDAKTSERFCPKGCFKGNKKC